MQNFDDMEIQFWDENKRNSTVVLSERPMLPTRYHGSTCMGALGIERSIIQMCFQLDWEEFKEDKNITYKQPTL